MVLDDVGLLRGGHRHRWVVRRVQRLVLHGDGGDRDPFGLHRLDVSHEVPGVRGVVHRQQAPADVRAVVLHPAGRRPRRGQQRDAGIDGEDLLQHGKEIGTLGVDRERREGGIGPARRHLVVRERRRAEIGGADAEPQVAHAERGVAAREQLSQERLARRGRHAVDDDRASAGERVAEAVHRLVRRRPVDRDRRAAGRPRAEDERRLLRQERHPVSGRHPHADGIAGDTRGTLRCGHGRLVVGARRAGDHGEQCDERKPREDAEHRPPSRARTTTSAPGSSARARGRHPSASRYSASISASKAQATIRAKRDWWRRIASVAISAASGFGKR